MVNCDLYIVGIGSTPDEANSVPIVVSYSDAYAVLTLPIAAQFLQPIRGGDL